MIFIPSTEFAELYPAHSEGMDKILLYILNRPEEDFEAENNIRRTLHKPFLFQLRDVYGSDAD